MREESDTIVEVPRTSEDPAPPSPSLAPVRMYGGGSAPKWVVVILIVAIVGSLVIAFSAGVLLYKFTRHDDDLGETQAALLESRKKSERNLEKLGFCVQELRACSQDVSALIAIGEHNAAISEEHRPAIEALITGENEDISSLRRKIKDLDETIEDRIDSMGNPRRKSREYWKSLARKIREKEHLTDKLRQKEAEYFLKAEQIKSAFERDSQSPDIELRSRNENRAALIDKFADPSSF